MNRLKHLAACALGSFLLCQASTGLAQHRTLHDAQGSVSSTSPQLFVTAPAPEYLADILFKPRYRNAVPRQGAGQQPSSVFSMLIHFAFDSTQIEPQSLAMLDSIGQMLHMPRLRHEGLVIEGHTDAVGGVAYNQGLSERRAAAIKDYLVASFALDPDRLVTVGYGKLRLREPSKPLSATNRRVGFRALRSLQVK